MNCSVIEVCAYLSVGGQFVEKPSVESAMFEYNQTLSLFPVVFRADVVPALKEQSRIIKSESRVRT